MMSANFHCREHDAKVSVTKFDTFASVRVSADDFDDVSILLADIDAAERLANSILDQCQTIRAGEPCEAVA